MNNVFNPSISFGGNPAPTPSAATDLAAFILLDRSGSMSNRWEEAIGEVNGYVSSLVASGQPGADVTVAVFDSHSFDLLRDRSQAAHYAPIQNSEAHPRGLTPLYDSIIKTCSLAELRGAEKTVLVIITDGHENASREANKEIAKARLQSLRQRGWEIVFLGVEFDAFGDASAIGVSAANTLNTSAFALTESMVDLGQKTAAYTVNTDPELARNAMRFTDKDREKAAKRKTAWGGAWVDPDVKQ